MLDKTNALIHSIEVLNSLITAPHRLTTRTPQKLTRIELIVISMMSSSGRRRARVHSSGRAERGTLRIGGEREIVVVRGAVRVVGRSELVAAEISRRHSSCRDVMMVIMSGRRGS